MELFMSSMLLQCLEAPNCPNALHHLCHLLVVMHFVRLCFLRLLIKLFCHLADFLLDCLVDTLVECLCLALQFVALSLCDTLFFWVSLRNN